MVNSGNENTSIFEKYICGTLDGLGSKVDVRENEEVSRMNQVSFLGNYVNVTPYIARRKVWGKDQVGSWKC